MKWLYDDGRHYDALMPGTHDLPFYRRLVEKYGGPVLELACGTGRLTIPLRLSGADVTGIDSSPAMLEVAREKAKQRGADLQFLKGDIREFSFEQRFALIFIASNTLSHLYRREDVEACFRSVREHLAPEGRFVVDLFTPSVQILTRDPHGRFPVGEYEDPGGGGRIVVTENNRYDPATQVNHIMWRYHRLGTHETWEVPLDLRMFYPQEIDALVSYNGFAIEAKYGDFDERPFGSESPKQLMVCRRRGAGLNAE